MNTELKITDSYCTNCYKNSITNIISNSNPFNLQDNYILNIIKESNTDCTILVQNGETVIIRKILYDVETNILIPSCNTHIINVIASKKN